MKWFIFFFSCDDNIVRAQRNYSEGVLRPREVNGLYDTWIFIIKWTLTTRNKNRSWPETTKIGKGLLELGLSKQVLFVHHSHTHTHKYPPQTPTRTLRKTSCPGEIMWKQISSPFFIFPLSDINFFFLTQRHKKKMGIPVFPLQYIFFLASWCVEFISQLMAPAN